MKTRQKNYVNFLLFVTSQRVQSFDIIRRHLLIIRIKKFFREGTGAPVTWTKSRIDYHTVWKFASNNAFNFHLENGANPRRKNSLDDATNELYRCKSFTKWIAFCWKEASEVDLSRSLQSRFSGHGMFARHRLLSSFFVLLIRLRRHDRYHHIFVKNIHQGKKYYKTRKKTDLWYRYVIFLSKMKLTIK